MIEKTYAKILAEKRRDFIERGAPRPQLSRSAIAPCRALRSPNSSAPGLGYRLSL
jgi:hypothetical protein